IVFDLLGQLWEVPARGGDARPLTDAVRDTAEDLDPSYAPDGRVVFRGERDGRTGLWLVERGTGAPRQLTQLEHPEGYDGMAAWRPDGMSIALVRVVPPAPGGRRWRSTLALVDPADGSAREVPIEGPPVPDARDPAWAPDGTRLAFVAISAQAPRGGRIWVVGASGGKASPLSVDSAALAPAFSPEGRRIAYFAPDSAGRMQVWVEKLDSPGAGPLRLTSHADVTPTRVRWTPDGAGLIYSADGRLWKVSPAGGTPVEIRFTARLAFDRPRRRLPPAHFPEPGKPEQAHAFQGLALSPDARNIGMIALGKLWVMPVGGTPRVVADLPRSARGLAWSADGAEVAWSAGHFSEEDIFATEIAGGATHRVTALPGREMYPAYSPDGRRLAFAHGEAGHPGLIRVAEAGVRELTDVARTRVLDTIEINWVASDADIPHWTPQSDGMLRITGGWSPGATTGATIARLSGERIRLTRVPDSPIYLQWSGSTITFIRHSRLWRAPFDSTGLLAPPEPLGPDPAMYASAAADGTLLYISEGGLRLRAPDGREQRLGWPLSYTPPVAEPLLITNARIIDGTGAPATAPRDIAIEGGRIAGIAAPGTLVPGTRRVLDAGGGYIIPGLMDLHAHEYRPDLLPGFLYFGVTMVRDQGSPMAPLVAAADAIAAGVFEGARTSYGGLQFYTDWSWDAEDGLGIEPEADPEHAARSVALAGAFGAQHIKTRTFRRWDINARLITEAHRRGMRATGHCAHELPLVAAGMDAKEHAGFCSPRSDGYIYDDLVQLYHAADIAVVPTLSYSALAMRMTRSDLLDDDPELAPFLPDRASFDWMVKLNAAGRRQFARYVETGRQSTARLARAGVTIGTGTDIWQVPAGVHMELQELVAAGLTPLQAIRAATAGSARVLGAERDLGTVEVGKVADLVVLESDPTADIRNTRRIRAVVQGGRVVDRKGLRERFERN
ncbi:MAG TPA: amidohydrolase family protein, partial [Gemmatimonadales bacterium]